MMFEIIHAHCQETNIPQTSPWQHIDKTIRETAIPIWPASSFIYKNDQWQNQFMCGGGKEYLHRNPESRKRRRKGTWS
jgi:hypothetical protein